jgi:hypothetical protein
LLVGGGDVDEDDEHLLRATALVTGGDRAGAELERAPSEHCSLVHSFIRSDPIQSNLWLALLPPVLMLAVQRLHNFIMIIIIAALQIVAELARKILVTARGDRSD